MKIEGYFELLNNNSLSKEIACFLQSKILISKIILFVITLIVVEFLISQLIN